MRRLLLAIAVGLTAVSFAARLRWPAATSLVRLVDVDEEMSFPNWYSSLALAASCALLGAIARVLHRSNRRERLGYWIFLIATFASLSAEEIVGLHEAVSGRMHRLWHLGGFLAFSWVIPAGVLLCLFVLGYLRFLAALPAASRRGFVISGAVYVLGAVGMEMVGGKCIALYTRESLQYLVVYHVEELLEMCGIALFNAALLEHLAGLLGPDGLRVRVGAE